MSTRQRRRVSKQQRKAGNPRRLGARAAVALVAALSLPAAFAVLPSSAQALDLEVNSLVDEAPNDTCGLAEECDLREAIDRINDVAQPSNTITFQAGLSGQIALTMGQIEITENVTIQGPGADVLTVSGNGASRIFLAQTIGNQITIRDLAFADANVTGEGGAIFAATGTGGSLTIERANFTGNDATTFGGAISANDAVLTVRRSTFSGNTADTAGGAISAVLTKLTMDNTTISGNSASNGASGSGGGITYQSTFSSDIVEITNSTISNNTADDNGGGIASFPNASAPDPALSNTIVADNTGSFPGADVFGPVAASFSLIELNPGTVTTTVPGSNIFGQDPGLGPLVVTGGPTATRRPAASSPAIDKGSTAATTDQRGRPRPFDVPLLTNSVAAGADGADIGAVELTGAEAGVKRCGGRFATIVGTKRKITGTSKADVIVGTAAGNVIRGKGGKDVICGLGGPDTLVGGGGRDTLIGGPGRDKLKGGPGRDKLKGGPGRDTQIQ